MKINHDACGNREASFLDSSSGKKRYLGFECKDYHEIRCDLKEIWYFFDFGLWLLIGKEIVFCCFLSPLPYASSPGLCPVIHVVLDFEVLFFVNVFTKIFLVQWIVIVFFMPLNYSRM